MQSMQDAWHALSAQSALKKLGSLEQGLSRTEAAQRLNTHGLNTLPEAKVDGYGVLFLRQFQSPLIYILLAAAAIVMLIGEYVDGGIICAVLVFNALVGTVQEGKAQNTLRALKRFVTTTATVVRGGEEMVIPDTQVVPGDIIILREGESVPADARLLHEQSLKVDEASLTGESEPVSKTEDMLGASDLPVPERRNMVFRGTHVVAGRGTALVVATATHTVIGGIAKTLTEIDSEIPLKANIRHLSRAIIGVVAVVGVSLFLLGLWEGQELGVIFTTVVSLTVSIVPEGLPIVITLVLATGVWRMSKRNALVKKLQAVEALGQARVIAVDKTGTITKNELTVREVWAEGNRFAISGVGYEAEGDITYKGSTVDAANHAELLFAGKVAALCANARVYRENPNEPWRVTGDPTEAALLVLGQKTGFHADELRRELPLGAEVPFDYGIKYHATVHGQGRKALLAVVGAPERVLTLSTKMKMGGKTVSLTAARQEELHEAFAEMSERGLRVVAYATSSAPPQTLSPDTIGGLVFGGFYGMQDVLRGGVAAAIHRAEEAGIKVVMITGDHALTARAIAKDAGLWRERDRVMTGNDIEHMSADELAQELTDVSVFARVTPEHKLRIIEAYRKRGLITAMTGDGVNDAPSLVAADLGIAMGRTGTEVAKEAADIVLLDDNFDSIVAAIEEGRSIYKTIKKVALYLFSTGIGEVLTIVGALLLGMPLPLLAAQIIWLNFVTDGFLDVALAMEPKEKGLLSGRFMRPRRYLVDSLMATRMALMSLPMMIGTLFLFSQYLGGDMEKAWTISLTTLAVFQWFNAWNCRSDTESLFRMNPFSNRYLLGATGIIIGLQLLVVYHPLMQALLKTAPLTLAEWSVIVPVAASVVVIEEIRKAAYRRMRRVPFMQQSVR